MCVQHLGVPMSTFGFDIPAEELVTIPTCPPEKLIEIFADGGCNNRGKYKGIGAWAFVALHRGVKIFENSYGVTGSTNNRTELSAVLKALTAYEQSLNLGYHLRFYCDSKYVVEMWNKHFNSWGGSFVGLANQDLVEIFWKWKKMYKNQIELVWIKGHAGHEWNEYVDELCTKEMNELKRMADEKTK